MGRARVEDVYCYTALSRCIVIKSSWTRMGQGVESLGDLLREFVWMDGGSEFD